MFGPKDSVDLNKTIISLSVNSVEHEVLTAEEVTNKSQPFVSSALVGDIIILDLFSLC